MASVTAARALFVLNGAIWLLFGLIGLYLPAAGGEALSASAAIVSAIMFANAALPRRT